MSEREPVSVPRRYPLDYLDKLCLAGTRADLGVSSSPVWQLVIEGSFDEATARAAISRLVARYPLLASKVRAAKAGQQWQRASRLVYEVDEAPDLDEIFAVVDVRADAADENHFESLQRRIFDNVIHPVEDYPIHFTWARTADDAGVLFLQQNHGIADGKATFELIADFCDCYDAASSSAATAAESVDVEVGKLPEDVVAVPGWLRRHWYRFCGFFEHLAQLTRATIHPPQPLVCNVSRDFSGPNDVEHLLLDDDLVEGLRPFREALGLSVNDFIGGALAKALERWSAAQGVPVSRFNFLVVADARPRQPGRPLRSFANHLCSFLVDLDVPRLGSARAMAEAIHNQVKRQHERAAQIKKLLLEIMVTRLLPIDRISKLIFETPRAVLNYSFSNLIPISPRSHGGRFATSSWRAEALRIMTPSPFLQGVNTTVIRYAGQLCFNFNFKASVVDQPAVCALIDAFLAALEELIDEASEAAALPAPPIRRSSAS